MQLDSIHRNQRNYDVLYLDEFKGLLTAFENPTLRPKLNLTFAVMKKLIQNAKYIIISDADLDDFSLQIFETYFNKTVTKIDYTFKKLAEREVVLNTDCFQFVTNILTDLENGKKLYSPSQSCDKIMEIFEQIKSYNVTKDLNLKMVLVTGNYTELVNYENPFPNNNTALKQHVLENFNEYCKTCDYIAYTSTITSGVSYDEKTFDKCYAYTSDKGNSYRAFVQQLLRIRHIDSKTYEFYIDSRLEERTRDLIYVPYEYEYCRKLIRTSHQLKNMSIDEINSMRMLECCVPEIDENENSHYNAFVELVCA